jgi:hypothetical protein
MTSVSASEPRSGFTGGISRPTTFARQISTTYPRRPTRLTLPLRKGLKTLGIRLRVLGVVDDPMDVYFAEYDALDNAVKVNSPDQFR